MTPAAPPGAAVGARRAASRGRTPMVIFLAVQGIVAVTYYVIPDQHLALWTPLGVLGVAAVLIGVRHHRPVHPLGWYLLAGAMFCLIAGDTTYNLLDEVFGQVNPYPSWADPIYLMTVPLFVAGLLVLIRRRRTAPDRASLLDALIMTTGAGLLVWIYLVVPFYQQPDLTGLQRTVSVAYPLGDVLVLGILARLVTGGGLRLRSIQLLVVGALGLLTSDIVYGLAQLAETWRMGGGWDLGWIVFYTAWGAAALHPSMRTTTEPAPMTGTEVRPARIGVVATLGLVAPVVLVIDAFANEGGNAVTVGAFAAVLYLLVLLRLAGIVAVHREAVERERVLRICGESLVAAHDVGEIARAAFAGVAALAGARTDVDSALYLVDDPDACPVATSGGDWSDWDQVEMWSLAEAGGGPAPGGLASVSALTDGVALRGVLVVRGRSVIEASVRGAVGTLAAQVALAVEADRLATDVRRRQNAAHFTRLIQNASDVIVVASADGRLVHGAPAMARALGLTDVASGHAIRDLLHPDDSAAVTAFLQELATRDPEVPATGDWRLLHADGEYRSFEVVGRNLLGDPTVAGVVFTMRDVSERRALEEQLTYQAFHDGLTGLPNRALFEDRAAQALARIGRSGHHVAMIMLDVDDFKEVNETSGHSAGDDVLCAVGERLRQAMRAGDTAARLSGDEFAVLVENVLDEDGALAVVDRIMQAFVAPFVVEDGVFVLRASAGVVVAGDASDAVDLTELLLRADLALYAAKERGKGQFLQYQNDLKTQRLERVTRREELKRAVAENQFFLQYQPIVQIETGTIVGAEALVRWRHPRLGLVPPNDFIPLAEETGLIVPLGRWVLETACAQARRWRGAAGGSFRMSVNVSARQLQGPSFVHTVGAAVAKNELAPGALVLELTETALFHQAGGMAERLASLKDLGVKIAIDDFGTGYSSLGYLQNFAIDILKVDKSFIDGLGAGSTDAGTLAQVMISMAQLLRLEIVAEGIESVGQRNELSSLGCAMGQGYLYAKPLDADQLTPLLWGPGRLGPVPSPVALPALDAAGALAALVAPATAGSAASP